MFLSISLPLFLLYVPWDWFSIILSLVFYPLVPQPLVKYFLISSPRLEPISPIPDVSLVASLLKPQEDNGLSKGLPEGEKDKDVPPTILREGSLPPSKDMLCALGPYIRRIPLQVGGLSLDPVQYNLVGRKSHLLKA
jgi:hypothetical protein